MSRAREYAGTIATGGLLGYSLSRIGFSDVDSVWGMFALTEFRLIFVFGIAVVLLVPAWKLVDRAVGGIAMHRPIHPGTLAGGALFGLGWALSSACPSIAWVQVGEGKLAALFTIGGIFAGNYLYSVVHRRYFKFSTGSCLDE